MTTVIDPFLASLLPTLGLALGTQFFFFIFAAIFKTDKVTDLSYGLTFIILSVFLFIREEVFATKDILITAMVCIWGVRLISYLFVRILLIKKDRRFDGIRENFFRFLAFWFFQGISVWIIMLPVTAALTSYLWGPIERLSIIGIIIWGIGLLIETVADIQKFNFKKDPENKDLWIETGLWKYSRHPNYFGEILCWIGVFVTAFPLLTGFKFIGILSPIYITTLLLFVSGIPPLEKRYDKKYKDEENYKRYKKTTNLLIPWFKAK